MAAPGRAGQGGARGLVPGLGHDQLERNLLVAEVGRRGVPGTPWNQAVEVGNSTRGCKSRRVTGLLSGGSRFRTQLPKRRIVRVMYGVIVARSSVSTGWPSAARALAASVMSSAVEYGCR